ncbi:6-phosphofructokinase [Verruconis gallopava]|uniref:ATP-dependent 6-phosphofructokinase n=1 Tax=Verruconis gallopava TaxID=253628 RepID=A0A0D2AP87_9PEZI|nr:6-phosphofructokinase [Verruconis gallopava]KIW08370.1 6-phosphofructokinase [Verruconis gallopava]
MATATPPNNAVPPPLPGHKRRIAVLTSGGDAPGMNGAVRAVVRMAIAKGCEAFCVYEGYEGLVQGNEGKDPKHHMIKRAEWDDVRGYLSEGGTLIGSARCASFRERWGRLKAAKNMVIEGIDALVVCGGDGSLTGADLFRKEWSGLLEELVSKGELTAEQIKPFATLNIVGLVGSIDNDMSSTDATIGCYSSLHRICESVDSINDTAQSHQRAFIIEVMGRHCGWLALMAAIATGADFLFIPEHPPEEDWKKQIGQVVMKHRAMGKRTTIVIIAEGAIDRDLKKITPSEVKDLLSNGLKLDTRVTTLGHVQRGGSPCAYDRMLSTLQGAEAVNAVLEATPETPSPVISIIENKIVRKPLLEAVKLTQDVAKAIEAKNFPEAMKLRDSEFGEYYRGYLLTTSLNQENLLLPENQRMRVGIIHVGAPAGGMNAATRAAIAYCFAKGHTPVTLHNSFTGLVRHHSDEPLGSVRDVTWVDAEAWCSRGGSELGTNRTLPSKAAYNEEDGIPTIAQVFKDKNINALFIVGGFEAFASMNELRKAREKYDSLKIPMVLLPATVSNNVPGTEYSLGSDTCLNALIEYCDTCRQSASSSRRRVFVIETQGGESGYIATVAGLSIGALAVYTPEEGVTIKMLDKDIDFLREIFSKDRGQSRAGKIILNNEKASSVYTTDIIARIIAAEAKGRFEARVGIPGHFQQGKAPSPMDRVRALRFGIKSLQHLESFAGKSADEIANDPMSCAVIGIRGARVRFTDVVKIETEETDWKHRRPKHEHWMGLKQLVDMLSGRPKTDKVPQVPATVPV